MELIYLIWNGMEMLAKIQMICFDVNSSLQVFKNEIVRNTFGRVRAKLCLWRFDVGSSTWVFV